jgi:hypothetical protein
MTLAPIDVNHRKFLKHGDSKKLFMCYAKFSQASAAKEAWQILDISDSTSQLPKQAKYTCSNLDSVCDPVRCLVFDA